MNGNWKITGSEGIAAELSNIEKERTSAEKAIP